MFNRGDLVSLDSQAPNRVGWGTWGCVGTLWGSILPRRRAPQGTGGGPCGSVGELVHAAHLD